ncbi:MAG: hypothetical protein RLP15_02650 [Cryomorphaceae bacterium]
MRTLLGLLLICLVSTVQAQGLTEEFKSSCECWVVKNHYDNGEVSAVYHENKKRERHGILKQYASDGHLLKEEVWKNGKLDGIATTYHPDGSVYLKATYDNGKKVGKWTFMDPDGTPSQEIDYTGNGADGTYAHYYAGVRYAEQVIEKGKLMETRVLNQEIYDIVQEEAAATEK